MSEIDLDPSMWLNSVRAVPTIGLKFSPTIDTAASLIARLKPLLLKWQMAHPGMKIGIQQEIKVKIERPDGLEITVAHDQLACKFYYLSKLIERGQLQPVVKYQSAPIPFGEICDRIQEALGEVLAELSKEGNRSLALIGVVAEGNLDPDSLPPGFFSFFKYLERPWSNGLIEIKSNLLAKLQESDGVVDRCHHMVERLADEESVVNFKLDWQRVWQSPESPNSTKLKAMISDVRSAAFNYFGAFGLGELAYE